MALEHWNPRRRKWVLYRHQAEHTSDCELYPLAAMPRRVFLDTNVVNLLVRHHEQIFEQDSIPADFDVTTAHDVEALMHVFHVGARASWDILASSKVLDEIDQTPDADLKAELLEYALQLVGLPDEDRAYATRLGRQLVDTPFLAALPDHSDRELIGNAVGFQCDVFCTCDRRTIIRKRQHVTQLPIRILTPVEWWAHVKPWAALWG